MISKKMQKALNDQMSAEFFSSYLYLSMSAYFQNENWGGFANWMKKQSEEEYAHALKFYNYLTQVGGKVTLDTIEKPKNDWKSALNVFEESRKHELTITGKINALVDLAIEEKDHATNIFLQWFVTEQVEEVATVDLVIHKLKMVGENKGAFYMLDREMGKRT